MINEETTHRLAQLVGIITTPPAMAGVAAAVVHIYDLAMFGKGVTWYLITLLLLTVIPLLSYVAAYILPSIRAMGRKGQRKLAFVISGISYVVGSITCLIAEAPRVVSLFFLSYLQPVACLLSSTPCSNLKQAVMHRLFRPNDYVVSYSWAFRFLGLCRLPLIFWARLKL